VNYGFKCDHSGKVKYLVANSSYCYASLDVLKTLQYYIHIGINIAKTCYTNVTITQSEEGSEQLTQTLDYSIEETIFKTFEEYLNHLVINMNYIITLTSSGKISHLEFIIKTKDKLAIQGTSEIVKNSVKYIIDSITSTKAAPGYISGSKIRLISTDLKVKESCSDISNCLFVETGTSASEMELTFLQFGVNKIVKYKSDEIDAGICAITQVAAFAASDDTLVPVINGTTPDTKETEKKMELIFLTSLMGKSGQYQRYIMGVKRTAVNMCEAESIKDRKTTLTIKFAEYLPQEVKNDRKARRRSYFHNFFNPFA